MEDLILGLRVAVSLAVVLGIIWFITRRVKKSSGTQPAKPINIISRHGLGQKAAMVIVDAEGQRFILGVTETAVTVIHQADAPVITTPIEPEFSDVLANTSVVVDGPVEDDVRPAPPKAKSDPLAGSILSPETFRQAGQALKSRTKKR